MNNIALFLLLGFIGTATPTAQAASQHSEPNKDKKLYCGKPFPSSEKTCAPMGDDAATVFKVGKYQVIIIDSMGWYGDREWLYPYVIVKTNGNVAYKKQIPNIDDKAFLSLQHFNLKKNREGYVMSIAGWTGDQALPENEQCLHFNIVINNNGKISLKYINNTCDVN